MGTTRPPGWNGNPRYSTNFQAQAEGLTTEDLIARLLKQIPVPEIPKFAK